MPDMPVNGVQCVAELDRSGWPVGGDEGSQHPVVDLAVEHGNALPVLGELVGVAAGQPLDEPVDAEPGEVVAHLVGGVGGAEQSGDVGAQAPVGEAGDGVDPVVSAPTRAMTRGSPNRRAGALLPPTVVEGSATRSKAGLARTQPW